IESADMSEDSQGYFSINELASDHGDPLENLSAADFKRTLVRVIEGLPEREKLVLSLSYAQDLNYKEIGEVIGLSQGRVCQLRAQAIARIRAQMNQEHWHGLPDELESHL